MAAQVVYRKSSYSGNGANCVEVALTPANTHVRDSKHPLGGTLTFTPDAWAGLVHTTTNIDAQAQAGSSAA